MSVLVMELQQLTIDLIMVCHLCQSFLQLGKKKEEAHLWSSSASYGGSSSSRNRFLRGVQVGWKANTVHYSG